MNAQTITDRLFQDSDKALMTELRAVVAPYWQACKAHDATRPEESDYPCLKEALNQVMATSKSGGVPWHGAVQELFVQTMFAFLRDARRGERVAEFMAHVEAVKDYVPPEE